jgi:hypothetical protein
MLTQLRNPTSSNKKLQPCKDFNLRQYTSIRTNAADQKKKKKKKKKVYLACPCMLQCVSGLVDKEARHGRACSTMGAFYLLYVYDQSIEEDDDAMGAARRGRQPNNAEVLVG